MDMKNAVRQPLRADVDGYEKRSATTVEGSPAAICDEAEQMLTDMHATLEDKFGVKMGEVFWPGKDPNRQLRHAAPLPKNQQLPRTQHVPSPHRVQHS
ncbi:MAG: hypothetical protein F6K09_09395 [Merismopedia sp. SIO2A8]|nr:hypothetical protein [Merismopedia sp. SIO2A8]